ncbi:hypothetical protein BGZ83_001232 [Gryganskiella cystojenkinii]|nr:hypothetical protein BGZ83_001232 [Gryganskiella cystojenkinii]
MVQEVQDGIDRTWHTRLRDLRLETEFYDMVMFECHFGLIRKSPDLVRLYWTKDFFQSSYPKKARFGDQMARMAEEIRGRQGFSCPWRRLEALSLPGLEFDRDDFAIVIEALSPTLQELHLNWTSFDDDTWEALRAGGLQLQTCLRILNLRHCKWLLGLTVQDIMCTMQGLEVFSADWISDTDAVIEASRHWVCTQMRELSIGIVLCENTTEPHILKRLSELRQLEVLNLSLPQTAVNAYNEWMLEDGHEPQREVEDDLDLKLTLEQGLDALKTLKKLRVLELPGRVPMKTWSVEEAKWIKHHWPRLEKIVGKKQDNEEIRLMLADVWDW